MKKITFKRDARRPVEFAKFAHSSSWDDIQAGFKG